LCARNIRARARITLLLLIHAAAYNAVATDTPALGGWYYFVKQIYVELILAHF